MKISGISNFYEKALIIDDELDTCLLLSMLLKKFGIPASRAHTLEAGLTALQLERPQLIFIDNNLPDGLGIDHISAFKQQVPDSKLVMITAVGALREQALSLGADGFIEKPLDIKKIKEVL